jgi:PQQ-dependent dehydrogenase (s-GDH family)
MKTILCSLLLLFIASTTKAQTCTGTGNINIKRWNNIMGTTVSSLTSNTNYPNNPSATDNLSSFEITSNNGNNYGVRIYGYICAPATGNYRFWIAGNDNCSLFLSTASSATNKVRIAFHTGSTNSRQWNKYTTQKSAAISLTAGETYYIEALMKDGTGADNLAVGWAKPGQPTTAPSQVIPGSQLKLTANDTQAPTAPGNITTSGIGQAVVTLTWGTASDDVDVKGYDVFQNGVKINTALVAGLSYRVTGLTPGNTHTFTIKAIDPAGNISVASAPRNVTTNLPPVGTETFTQRTVLANQSMPHDLVYGPDNKLWFIERFSGKVSFVDPTITNPVKTTVLTLGNAMARTGGQDGLFGLALHPSFTNGKPYVYLAYTHESTSITLRKTKIERYTYNSITQTLGNPVTIITNIPGSNDHNSGRLEIGPDALLYYTVGDMGAGQFDNASRVNNAQDLAILEGKILRFNTEEINGSWIPTSNPYVNDGVRTPVYSFGHRNPQGLVWGNVNNTSILYSTEHGPFSDDEVNIIEVGRNYGWPNVIGFCDGNYNGRTTGGFTINNEQANCTSLNAKEPIKSLFAVATPPNETSNYITWPSVAPSGTTFYGSNAIPGWQHSLLIAQLKKGAVCRLKLSTNGLSVTSDTIHYFKGLGRFRDVVVSPDGLKIYVACDSSGQTSGPTGGVVTSPANPGSILEFTYQPPTNTLATEPGEAITGNSTTLANERNVLVYPNPANNYVTINTQFIEIPASLSIYDINGRVVKQVVPLTTVTTVPTGNLQNGTYVLKIVDRSNNVMGSQKIIVQH